MAGGSAKVVVVAFLMNLGIALAKYVAFLFTGSAAMLAEAVHSLADTINQIFLYLGLKRSQKAASATHPFGYGMEQYIFSFLVAILIFSLGGAYSLYEGVHKLMEPSDHLEHADINLIILAIAVGLEGYSSFVATKELKKSKGSFSLLQYIRRTKDQVLVTVLFEDYAALMGLTVAALGMAGYLITGLVIFDTLATLLIGVLLVAIAVVLYNEAKSLLVGEAASEEDQAHIRGAFERHPGVENLTELLTMHLAVNQILVNAHVKFRAGLTVEEVEDIIDEIEEEIVAKVPEVFKIFIETHQKPQVEDFKRKDKDGHAEEPAKRRSTSIRPSKDNAPTEN